MAESPSPSTAWRPDASDELRRALRERILVIDGAMGTAIQRDRPDEAGYRGERFADWPQDLVGNNDLLTLTQPEIIASIHREYLESGADLIETNTFNANAVSLSDYGMEELSYELNYAGVLRCAVAPPEKGRTGFMDGIECYRQFPRELRERIEGLNVIYTLDTRLSKMRYGVNFELEGGDMPITQDLLKEVAIFPRAMHPAVWTRETGEKVMHVGSWMTFGIEHHEDPEGDRLLDDVCHQINKMGHGTSAYWHDWSPTDMLIWDNHRMLHAVEGCDPKYERHTIRSTIQGDYGHGYFEDGKKIGEVYREKVFAEGD